MINQISVDGFRNINIPSLNLGRVNCIHGESGCGKTNFLNVLGHLGRLVRVPFSEVFGTGPRAIEQILYRHKSPDRGIVVKVKLTPFQDYFPEESEEKDFFDSAEYLITVRRTSPEAPLEVTEESLIVYRGGEAVEVFSSDEKKKISIGGNRFNSNRDASILNIYRNNLSFPEIRVVSKTLSRQISYRFDPYKIGTPQSNEDNTMLGFNGSGLPTVLYNIRRDDEERFDKIYKTFYDAFPRTSKITLPVINAGKFRALGVIEDEYETPFTAREMGDSALVMLAIITLANYPEAPSLICIDDIDRYLSRDMMNFAVNTLVSSPILKDRQFIFTCKDFDDFKTEDNEDLFDYVIDLQDLQDDANFFSEENKELSPTV